MDSELYMSKPLNSVAFPITLENFIVQENGLNDGLVQPSRRVNIEALCGIKEGRWRVEATI